MAFKHAISVIWEGIKEFFQSVGNVIKKIIRGVLNFAKEVVDYFKSLALDPRKDTPFLIDSEVFKEKIKKAPRVKVEGLFTKQCGLLEGVYNEDTNEITNVRQVEADALDEGTQDVMSKAEDGIVTLC